MKKLFFNSFKSVSYKLVLLVIMALFITSGLTACDMGPFADEEDYPTGLPEFDVPGIMWAYYEAIEYSDPEQLAATLPEEDEEIVITLDGYFYEQGHYDIAEYEITVEEYVNGYDHDYLERFNVTDVDIDTDDIEIEIDDDEAFIEVAEVEKEIYYVEDPADTFEMEYTLEMEMEYREDEYWVILEIHKFE